MHKISDSGIIVGALDRTQEDHHLEEEISAHES